ncbi:cation:proton antiporter [Patescibacteria group bacterium]|nr:cation:proton antiporter [Patescibacteria group bacterium]
MENLEILLVLMVVIWVAGKVFRALKLPVIFGELLGGIIVGPMVLNLVPADSEVVHILAELGIFFLMFHSGLETDPNELLRASKKSTLIAIAGVVFPFIGGYWVSRYFGQSFEQSLFIAMGLSITAIAISIRLFKDYKIQKSRVAHITVGAAIIDDILALILFSMVLSIIESGAVQFADLAWLILKVVVFFGVVIAVGYKTSNYLQKVLRRKGFTFALITALTLGLIAEAIGLHIIIGAFLAGLFIRQEVLETQTFNKIEDRIYGLSYSFLGPIFFASLAFYLDFTALTSAPWFLLAIIVVAVLGKVIGSGLAAYLQKINFRESLAIGLAMNSRGAIELIIASIGIKEGIIDTNVFSILVMMAFATTIISIFSIKPLAKQIRSDMLAANLTPKK